VLGAHRVLEAGLDAVVMVLEETGPLSHWAQGVELLVVGVDQVDPEDCTEGL